MDFKVRTFVGLFIFTALMFSSGNSYSQPPGDDTKPCLQDPCPPVPISGIEILLAGGAALGVRKLLKSKKSDV